MKKILSAAVAMALLTPSVALASPAAQSLSIKSAAVKPVRAAAKPGKAAADDDSFFGGFTMIALLGAVLVGGMIALQGTDDSR